MPLSRVIGAITGTPQHLWQEPSPGRAYAPAAAWDARERVAANLLGVISREECRPARPATGRVVGLTEAQTVFGKSVELRRADLAAVTAEIGVTEIVGKQYQ